MFDEGLDRVVLKKLDLDQTAQPKLKEWNAFLERFKNPKSEVEIALIGKYVELKDSYKSISEALIHAGATNEVKVNIRWIHSEQLTIDNVPEQLAKVDGILVAPGFGNRGIEGKIDAVRYAREQKIPFLGICLGMQMAVIEYSRNVLGLSDANSTEMDENTSNPVISLMEDQKNIEDMGGTMRLGAWIVVLILTQKYLRPTTKRIYLRDTVIAMSSIVILKNSFLRLGLSQREKTQILV
jgi:CTP synthase